jgi:hypothetical protein
MRAVPPSPPRPAARRSRQDAGHPHLIPGRYPLFYLVSRHMRFSPMESSCGRSQTHETPPCERRLVLRKALRIGDYVLSRLTSLGLEPGHLGGTWPFRTCATWDAADLVGVTDGAKWQLDRMIARGPCPPRCSLALRRISQSRRGRAAASVEGRSRERVARGSGKIVEFQPTPAKARPASLGRWLDRRPVRLRRGDRCQSHRERGMASTCEPCAP